MSISFDDLDILVGNSPFNMFFLATGNLASPSNDSEDPQGTSSTVLSTLTDDDHPSASLTLDSFIPILRHLPGLYLGQNLYYIRGSIAAANWERLRDYVRMASKFIPMDAVNSKGSKARISPAAFFRLALSQEPEMPFFPSRSRHH